MSVLSIPSNATALGAISGRVTGPDGVTPLQGVSAHAYIWNATGSNWEGCGDATTDADGNYNFPGLTSGNYRVGFSDGTGMHVAEYFNNKSSLDAADDIPVTIEQAVTAIDASLELAGHITGRVTGPDGVTPLQDVQARAYIWNASDSDWEVFGDAITDANGNYDIGGLSTGAYRVKFSDAQHFTEYFNNQSSINDADDIPVTIGQTITGIDASLALCGHITGRVTGPDGVTPLQNIYVNAYVWDASNSNWGWGGYYTYTDADGNYIIGELQSGIYRVEFKDWSGTYAYEYFNNKSSLDAADDIPVTIEQTVTGIDASLALAGHITGRVTATNGVTPLEDISVDAYIWTGTYGIGVATTTTDADGNYNIGGLVSGTYRVRFMDGSSGQYFTEYFDNQSSLHDAEGLPVIIGQTVTGIDASLAIGGHITGRVTGPDGVTPLQSIRAYLYIWNGSTWTTNDGNFVYTDADGNYDIRGLASGNYRVSFYDESHLHFTEYFNNKTSIDLADDIPVTLGQTVTGIDASLALGGQITGRVTGPDGLTPLQGVSVRAYVWNGSNWYAVGGGDTGADGNYDIHGLESGTYRVEFCDDAKLYITEYYNDQSSLDAADDILVTAGDSVTGIDASLSLGGHITGRVTGPDGLTPLQGIRIDCFGSIGVTSFAWTDSDGNYVIDGLPSGNYRLYFNASGLYLGEYFNDQSSLELADVIPVTAGQTTTGIDASLALYGHITGRVTGPDGVTPLQGVRPNLYIWDGSNWNDSYRDTPPTDADGNYDIGGLASGNYRVQFRDGAGLHLTEYYNDKSTVDAADDILVTVGQTTTGIDASLSLGGHITGRVTGPDGVTPLEHISVSAYIWTGSNWIPGYASTIDAGGNYDICVLESGNYRVQFWDSLGLHLTEYYNDKSTVDAADDIPVTVGQTITGIDASLALGGHITGRVTGPDGVTPLPWIRVYPYIWNGSDWEQQALSGYTGAGGNYNISGLASGNYRVRFSDEWPYLYFTEYFNNKSSLDLAEDIPVTAGETVTGINASLVIGGHITGRVTGPDGVTPLQNIYVRAYIWDESGSNWKYVDYYPTDANGNYDISRLVSGNYRLEFQDSSGAHVTEYYNNKSSLDLAEDIPVTVGQTIAGINASLESFGHITGRVTGPDGVIPLQNVYMYAYIWDESGSKWNEVKSAWPDASGNYDIGGLVSGTYRVQFRDNSGLYFSEYYNDKSTLDFADDIPITLGQTIAGIDASLALSICPTITLLPTPPLLQGTVDETYNQTITAGGGIEPYTFTITAGALPDGLSPITNDGLISGMPTAPGTFTFTVTATDANGCTGLQEYTIDINECTFTLLPVSKDFNSSGGTDSVSVDASDDPCTWTTTVNPPADTWIWITSGDSGTGDGTVTYTVDVNPDLGPRIGTLTIAGENFTVNQEANATTFSPSGIIPDTGQTQCYDADGNVLNPCPADGQAFYGQDGCYTINPLSYTKLDADGYDLPDDAETWVMVRDNVTGLIWMFEQAPGAYTWDQAIAYCNDLDLYGQSDWRLPTFKELTSILNYGDGPTTDRTFFPDTFYEYYWSSTESAQNPDSAWCTDFSWGSDNRQGKGYGYAVRAVRGGQSDLPDHLVINDDGTVTDMESGLMWQQATAPGTHSWEQALTYAENLELAGYNDWRLPTVKELRSIADYTHYSPTINTTVFPDTMAYYYWSSTTLSTPNYARNMNFTDGWSYQLDKGDDTSYVRAVRCGQNKIVGGIFITSPNQGESYSSGDMMDIRWDDAAIGGNVDILISREGGKIGTFTPIAFGTPNDGEYDWTIDGAGSVNCVIKIEPVSDSSKASSAGLFVIQGNEIEGPPWPCFLHDAQHTGRSSYNGPSDAAALKWRYPTGNTVESSPAIGADGTVYVGSRDRSFRALNPVDGTLKWQYGMHIVSSSPAIGGDGTVYVGSQDSYVYALNPADGILKWRYLTGGGNQSSPVIGQDGTVYIGSQDSYVYALNPADGSLKWRYQTGSWLSSSPAIGQDGTIYIGSSDHYIYALNPVDGALKWRYQTGNSVSSSPAIGADGTVYIGSTDYYVYALNPEDGSLKWRYLTGTGYQHTSPAIGQDGTVYIGSNDHYVYALNPADGTLKWRYLTAYQNVSSPAIGADGTVYVGSQAYIYALNPADGTLKWQYLTESYVSSSPAIGQNGTLYVGSGFYLYALESSCAYTLSSSLKIVGSSGETGSVNVDTSDNSCTWTAESNDIWITITSGADYTGDDTVNYTVDANPGVSRSGTMTIAGETFTVSQASGDTDNDGLPDVLESAGCTDPYDADTDDDGILDGDEDVNHNGIVDEGETNPCNIDTDGDGIQDGTELGFTLADIGPDTDLNVFQPDMDNASTTNPLNPDSDGDGAWDGAEDANHNGRVDAGEYDPNDPSSIPVTPPVAAKKITILNENFDSQELPQADWSVNFTQGAANVFVDTANSTLVLVTAPDIAPGSAAAWGNNQFSVSDGTLIFKSRVAPYVDGSIYGDAQPRGLVAGTDRNNAIEFINAYPVPNTVSCRTVSNGIVSETFVDIGQHVGSFNIYQIVAASNSVKFYINGKRVATHTTNIPVVPLNVYYSTGDSGFGNVPVSIDYVSFDLVQSNSAKIIEWNGSLVADFGEGRGLFMQDGNIWIQLTGWGDVHNMLVWGSNLVVDFGAGRGLFTYNGTGWTQLTGWDEASEMIVWENGTTNPLVVDFGQSRGLYYNDGTSWTLLTGWDDVNRMMVWNNNLVVDFGDGRGLYYNDGTNWNLLTGWDDAANMMTWNNGVSNCLMVDFGQGRGLYYNDGTNWNFLTGWDDTNRMLVWNNKLVVDFGFNRGTYYNDGSWHMMTGWDGTSDMIVWNNTTANNLVVDFGGGRGLYYNDGASWNNLTGYDDTHRMITWGANLVVDFGGGRGTYYNDNNWHELMAWDETAELLEWDTSLVSDFGPGKGVYQYTGGSWNQLTGWSTAE